MSQVFINSNSLTDIANAIRAKNKQNIKYKPLEMADAINSLSLDNNSKTAWKYSIDPNLEHQVINVTVNADLMGDNTTGYKSETVFAPSSITSDLGYVVCTIKKTSDSTNHIVNFSANPVTETNTLIQNGWKPVYIIDDAGNKNYYTTTTPDDVNSFKAISRSNRIENILICGYYTKDSSTGKLSSAESDQAYIGRQLVTDYYTKKIKNTYVTSISDSAFDDCWALTSIDVSNATSIGDIAFAECSALTSIDLPNVTSIGESAFKSCISLTSIDVSNATSIGDDAFYNCTKLTSIDISNATNIGEYAFDECPSLKYIVINNNTVSTAHVEPASGVKVLIPQLMMDTYSADSYWSKYKSQLDAIENYTITRGNGQITVTPK